VVKVLQICKNFIRFLYSLEQYKTLHWSSNKTWDADGKCRIPVTVDGGLIINAMQWFGSSRKDKWFLPISDLEAKNHSIRII